MGNCCEVVDERLEELMNMEKVDSFVTVCSSDSVHSRESNEEKNLRFRKRSKKLNTIIEDNQEDHISSPFMVKNGRILSDN
jgi:hypothetical protein